MSSTDNTLGDMVSRVTLADISPPSTPPRTNERKTRARDESEKKPCPPEQIPSAPLSPPASPLPNGSKFTNGDKASAEDKNQPSVSNLRTRLGIDSWKCGCTTQDGHPCTKPMSSQQADINTQIESVIGCSHLSPKLLRDELFKLAKLVHCQEHHNTPIKWSSRVDIWRNKFNVEESVEEQIEKILQYYDRTCVGMNKKGKPCGSKIGGWRVCNRAKTIDIILDPDTYLIDNRLGYFLQVLEKNMFCDWHINDQGPVKVAAWKKEIQKIHKERNLINPPEDEDSTVQPTSLIPDIGPADFWPHEPDTTPFEIISSNIPSDFKSSFPKIHKVMEKPLEQEDQEKGYIYAYKVEGNDAFVKIGYTTDTPEKRQEKWDLDCNRKPIALYPVPPTPRVMVPNAPRVEELCHAELNHRNSIVYCRCCLKKHIEWFEVSPEEAIAVIQKWSRWMLTKPYNKLWRLKKKEGMRAKDIDQFMKELSANQPREK